MLGPNVIKDAPLPIQKLLLQLQEYGIWDIARRISKYSQITSSAEYMLTTLMEQDIFNRNFKEEVRKTLGLTNHEIDLIFRRAAEANYIYDKRAFIENGIPFVPFEENYFTQMLARNIIKVTQSEMQNITGSLGFAVRQNGKLVFKPAARFYQEQLDLATASITTGVKTFDQALSDAIRTMADSGMRTVDYASGRKDRIDVASRRAIMGGMRTLTNTQSDYNSGVMKSTVFEISWHGGHRPSHAWGGRRFDTKGVRYPTEQQLYEKYTSPDNVIGTLDDYNCYHEKYAVFYDSPTKYTDEVLENLEAQEKQTIEYQGKSYNAYEARQQQRYLERIMRRQQSVISGFKGAVSEAPKGSKLKDDLRNANIKMRQVRKQYREFSNEMGITPEFERVNSGLRL